MWPVYGCGVRRRVHERYKVGEGSEYSFRLSESGTVSGGTPQKLLLQVGRY
jgi:hypothetical protein